MAPCLPACLPPSLLSSPQGRRAGSLSQTTSQPASALGFSLNLPFLPQHFSSLQDSPPHTPPRRLRPTRRRPPRPSRARRPQPVAMATRGLPAFPSPRGSSPGRAGPALVPARCRCAPGPAPFSLLPFPLLLLFGLKSGCRDGSGS